MKSLTFLFTLITGISALPNPNPLPQDPTPSPAAAPVLPLSSSSRWILDGNNKRIKLRCLNWAGHLETNVPEGLHRQPLEYITSWIASNNFNCVRLTFSSDLTFSGPTTPVHSSFTTVSQQQSKPALINEIYPGIISKNPWITANTTTLDVFAKVVDSLWAKGVMTILDNHVSKASWCCNLTDGNGWWDTASGYNPFNSRFFHTDQWLKSLQFMAAWAKKHRGVVGMGLRNELRAFLLQDLNGRKDWYTNVKKAGDLVHLTNPDLLILVGGAQSSTDLVHLKTKMLDTSGWKGKHVWEMHAYSFTVTFPDPFKNCDLVKAGYGFWSGFVLEQNKAYTGPLIMSEFGVGMQGSDVNGQFEGLNEQDHRYLDCLVGYLKGNDAEWAVWAIQGSYYIREGTIDYDETWGLIDHEWKGWRNEKFRAKIGDLYKVTQGP
ncbi:glycoside hydrolase superfamily [Triangularia verruculosa]|uniref:Glycoside hydrolase superfamily n=1 Tax=Triangularia verruculosa TaxID=2587418 RepID=A0AAN6XH71_9PEZI|nr:glycoside hydrolase superfamily [Triangularia verruculosa]